MKKLLVILPFLFLSQAGSASRYDPDCKISSYRVDHGIYGKGPIWIISWLLPPSEVREGVNRCFSGWNLEINYSGYLARDRTCDPTSFHVGLKLNGKGFYEFPLKQTIFDGKRIFKVSLYQPSKIKGPNSPFDLYMEDLFFWAFDEHGRLNDWNLEFYFKANCLGAVRYDSRYGTNYNALLSLPEGDNR